MGQPGIHPNVASGDAHIREVLAFRLDWTLTLTLTPNPSPLTPDPNPWPWP